MGLGIEKQKIVKKQKNLRMENRNQRLKGYAWTGQIPMTQMVWRHKKTPHKIFNLSLRKFSRKSYTAAPVVSARKLCKQQSTSTDWSETSAPLLHIQTNHLPWWSESGRTVHKILREFETFAICNCSVSSIIRSKHSKCRFRTSSPPLRVRTRPQQLHC